MKWYSTVDRLIPRVVTQGYIQFIKKLLVILFRNMLLFNPVVLHFHSASLHYPLCMKADMEVNNKSLSNRTWAACSKLRLELSDGPLNFR